VRGAIERDVRACLQSGPRRPQGILLFVTYAGRTGAATVVRIESISLSHGRPATCIRHAVTAAPLAPFTTPRITLEYDVAL
jgi:hypothetical protein